MSKCNALLVLGDDYGDNVCRIRCDLPEGHEGVHKCHFNRGLIVWGVDERFDCPEHGLQPDDCCRECEDAELSWWEEECTHGIKPRYYCGLCEGLDYRDCKKG